jgi:hypothetical protein
MSKVVRLEAKGLLHCSFHPLCLVTRRIDIVGVNYPRKAAQQFILKHEKKCPFNPDIHTIIQYSSHAQIGTNASMNNEQNNNARSYPFNFGVSNNPTVKPLESVLAIDCVVLYAWDNTCSAIKAEQKLRATTLVCLALSSSGLTVWPSTNLLLSSNSYQSAAEIIPDTKRVVLVIQAGDFKSRKITQQFLEDLLLAKQLGKKITVLLFDVPTLLTVVSLELFGKELLLWLQSPGVCTYVVQMKFFNVIISAIVNTM